MPRKKYSTYRRKKKTTLRRARRVPRNALVRSPYSGFPAQQRMKLRYVGYDELTSSVGAWDYMSIRANGCVDPDLSGTGHQPFGWDQMVGYYNHYVVNSCKLTATYVPTASGTPVVCSIYLADDASIPYGGATWQQLAEANRGTQRILANAATDPITVGGYYSATKFYNVKDVRDNFERIGALTSADPNELAVFFVGLQSLDFATTSATVAVKILLEYDVSFSEPKDIASS